MTLKECASILGPIALAFRADVDEPTFRAYHRLLKDVPPGLLEAGIEILLDAGQRFFPSAVELQQGAERARRNLLAAYPYEGCAECEEQRGFRTLTAANGQKTVQPCPCKRRHLERLEGMGLRSSLAQLPSEAAGGDEAVYPTLEQLPSSLRDKLQLMASQKVLR